MTGTAHGTSDPFAVLGVGRGASPDEVKAAWRRLVALYHPDNNPGFPAEATQKVRELNDAYAAIRDGRPLAGDGPTLRHTAGGAARPARPPHDSPPRRWDPPRPPAGPQVPPPRFADATPPRAASENDRQQADEARAAAGRRDRLVGVLAAAGLGSTDAAASADPLVAALLQLDVGGDIRCAVPYASLHAAGAAADLLPTVTVETTHVAPSLQVGGRTARDEAIARIARTRFAVVTGDALVWTSSTLDDGGDILIRERVDAWTVDRTTVTGLDRARGTIDVHLGEQGALRFELGRAGLVALGAALGLRR